MYHSSQFDNYESAFEVASQLQKSGYRLVTNQIASDFYRQCRIDGPHGINQNDFCGKQVYTLHWVHPDDEKDGCLWPSCKTGQ
ncbi:MAG: hypothetical protein ABIN18_01395 [Pseudomonadota bacterium]